MDYENLFGEDFVNYIEEEKSKGKDLETIAIEHNKTKESVRSKLKREKKKIISGTNCTPRVASCTPKKINKEKPNKITKKKDTNDIENKLDYIINLLEKKDTGEEGIQSVGQGIQIAVQTKETYVKTSIRIEENVWENFKNFSSEHKEFKQQDLVTLAFKEFLEKYK